MSRIFGAHCYAFAGVESRGQYSHPEQVALQDWPRPLALEYLEEPGCHRLAWERLLGEGLLVGLWP